METYLKLAAGTKILCPNCQAPQIECVKEIPPGMQLKEGEWRSLGFQMDSESAVCYKCLSPWFQTNQAGDLQLHTASGWVTLAKKIIIEPSQDLH